MTLVAAPIFLVLQQYGRMLYAVTVFAVTSAILKLTWYDKLEPAVSPARGEGVSPLRPTGPTLPTVDSPSQTGS